MRHIPDESNGVGVRGVFEDLIDGPGLDDAPLRQYDRGLSDAAYECEVGVTAPIRAHHGQAIAAINLSGPKYRFGARLEEAGILRQKAADQVRRCSVEMAHPGRNRRNNYCVAPSVR